MGEFSIQISSNLVTKLADDTEKAKKKTRRTKPKVPREPQTPQPKKGSNDSESFKGSGAKGWPLQTPLYMPAPPPPSQSTNADLDAIRLVVQDIHKIMERLTKQEENKAQEVTQKAKELRDKEFKLPYQKPMPCLAEKDACVDCYKEHGTKNPLKCAGFVNTYADCARKVRQQVSSGNK